MKKTKMLIVIVAVLLLCAAIFAGCGKKANEAQQSAEQTEMGYIEEYIGEPIDENGNQGELYVYLPEAFEQPAVESIEEEIIFIDDVQGEEIPEEIPDEVLEETPVEIPEIME